MYDMTELCRYGKKSSVNAAIGRNPDGSWAIAVARQSHIRNQNGFTIGSQPNHVSNVQ